MSNVKYYLVQYLDTDKQEYIKCTRSLVVGRIYNKDNRQVRAIRKAHFKYNIDDLDALYRVMILYSRGSEQYCLALKLREYLRKSVPDIKFYKDERELFNIAYYNKEYETESQKKALEKVLNIK